MKQWVQFLMPWATLPGILIGGFSVAQQPAATGKGQVVVSIDRFQLLTEGKQFFLQPTSPTKAQKLPIPRDWLIPPQEENDEDEEYVSSFRYDHRVTSFPVGNGEIGVRLSSYNVATEGSEQLAVGRDVFLIYDPVRKKLRPGQIDLGITKQRFRDVGCWYARMAHFLISDINGDGLADIGIIKEEIRCLEGKDRWEGESFEQHWLQWYVYTPDGWRQENEDSDFAGEWPDQYAELPLVGMESSPVDFVGQLLWRSPDPSLWKSPPRYLPTYRKGLIEGGPLRTALPPKPAKK